MRYRYGLGLAALLLLTAILYAPVGQYHFINWDDPSYITENPIVQGGLTLAGVKQVFTTFDNIGFYMPLTWLSFMADATLFGNHAGGFHLTSVLLHLLNTLILGLLLVRMTGEQTPSLLVTALFTLHPQHVEAVVWISERKEVLSALFGLLALYGYSGYVEALKQPEQNSRGALHLRLLLVHLMAILSLLAKPTWVTLPLFLLLLDIWPFGRLTVDRDLFTGNGFHARMWPLIREKLGLFLLSLVSTAVTLFSVQGDITTEVAINLEPLGLSALERVDAIRQIAAAFAAFGGMILKSFWPVDLAILYPNTGFHIDWPATLMGLALVVGITGLAWRARERSAVILVGWLWFLIALVPPILNIAVENPASDMGKMPGMADRWSYVAHIGLALAVIWGLKHYLIERFGLVEKIGAARGVVALSVAALLIPMAWQTARQVTHWQNSETLWRETIRIIPQAQSAYPHWVLSLHYLHNRRLDRALASAEKAHAIRPQNPYFVLRIANILRTMGREPEARAMFHKLLTRCDNHPSILKSTGHVALSRGAHDDAIGFLEKFIEIKQGKIGQGKIGRGGLTPDDEQAFVHLAMAWAGRGETKRAHHLIGYYIHMRPRLSLMRCHLLLLENQPQGENRTTLPELVTLQAEIRRICRPSSRPEPAPHP